ncbi:unnamed protein product [Triticum turgidum subsp. durum]|uniref:TF-B3 domain-containing protein n=2 Tax=Triticum TaxID=4564 RepID=A0A9R0W200_TRITD|nr:unnamed protein product [Triticum turgidum subsp. durum]
MNGDCENCAFWRDHYYWEHMGDEKKQFSAVAKGDFKNSIRIPRELSTHLRSRISDTIKLDTPNGRTYDVVVTWEFGELVLRSGWDAFVTAHHIEENDTFLFIYHGNSNFEIHIFNSRGCEKMASCFQPPSEIFGAFPPSEPCDHHVLNEQAAPNPRHVQTQVEFDYTMSTGCYLTKSQDEKVVEIARKIRSEIPLYVAIMKKLNVNVKDCSINIPLRLVSHLKEEAGSAIIKLEAPGGNIYNVRASKHSEDQVVLQSDWDAFVAANHIQLNDLLIFHSKGKTRLKVLALDPSGCEKNSSCFDTKKISKTGEGSVQITDARPCTVEIIDLTSSDDDHTEREDAGRSSGRRKQVPGSHAKAWKMASASSPSTKSGSDTHKLKHPISNNDNLQGPSRPPYILARGVTLTGRVEKKVQEKVQAIGSELPIYVAVMTKSCVGGNLFSLEFCAEYASTLPSRDQTLILELEDKDWHTTLHIKGSRKIIYRGWSKFACDNNLQLGDICLFKMAERRTRGLAMRVHFICKSGVFL